MGLTQITGNGLSENISIDSNTLKVDGTNNRIGIGTSSPANILHLSSTGTPTIQITDEDNSGIVKIENGSGSLFLNADTGNTVSNSRIQFSIDGSERLRIDSFGRVGIGNSSPSNYSSTGRNLVVGAGSSAAGLTVVSGATNTGNIYFAAGSTGDDQVRGQIRYNHSTEAMDLYTDASLRMRIDGSGDVQARRARSNTAGDVALSVQPSDSTIHYGLRIDSTNNSLNLDRASGTATSLLTIDSSGNVGIGINSPAAPLQVVRNSTNNTPLSHNYPATQSGVLVSNNQTGTTGAFSAVTLRAYNSSGSGQSASIIAQSTGSGYVPSMLFTQRSGSGTNAERMRIDSSGNVGIGTTSPSSRLHLLNPSGGTDSTEVSTIERDNSGYFLKFHRNAGSGNVGGLLGADSLGTYFAGGHNASNNRLYIDGVNSRMLFSTGGSERMRINSAGDVLIGTTSNLPQGAELNVSGSGVATAEFYNAGGCYNTWSSGGTPTARGFVGVSNQLVSGGSGTNFCIRAQSNLNFAAGGNATRLTIDHNGTFTNKSSNVGSIAGEGFTLGREADSYLIVTRDNDNPVFINRLTSDGDLIRFYGQGNQEGNIAVSGSTVSYLGGHLSRWSQLAGNAERTEILRGTVLSNLDEMCEWAHAAQDAVLYTEEDELPEGVSVGDVKTPAVDAYSEDNEQLNRMKVSDVEGDVNVAGIFQAWDDDDDTFTNDLVCAMTGDFVIRIAQGTTVARGDLLMSAGDGTAKPQNDDIVRSKTIAKVTSTTVSTTYSDGSYCVPCVLMAC